MGNQNPFELDFKHKQKNPDFLFEQRFNSRLHNYMLSLISI